MFRNFLLNINTARTFHQSLALRCHPHTYSSWVGDEGKKTLDRVEHRFLREHSDYQPTVVAGPAGAPIYIPDPNPCEGKGIDLWKNTANPSENGYYEVQSPTGRGDGTVPRSSGAGLQSKSRGVEKTLNCKVIKNVEHSAFYNDSEVQKFTMNCVKELAQKHFNGRMGK